MYLFLFDHIIQLDSLAPLIELIKKEKKNVIILNSNPIASYKKNKLLKYFANQNIKILNNSNTGVINYIILIFFKILCFLPIKIIIRFSGFWWKISNMVFFNTKEFQKFIEKNNVSKIIIPNDYVEAKKLFLNNLKKISKIKIIELEVGTRTLITKPYEKSFFPLSLCDAYISSCKISHKVKDNEMDKIKSLGCLRYSGFWIEKLSQIYKNEKKFNQKTKVGVFINDRIFTNPKNFIQKLKNIKKIHVEKSSKPKSILPEKCTPIFNEKFNATELIDWSDILISHSSSILIEAIIKKKKVFYCNFLKYEDKFEVKKSFFDNIRGFYYFENETDLINALENCENYINKKYTYEDIDIVNELKGFKNELTLIDNYKKLIKNL